MRKGVAKEGFEIGKGGRDFEFPILEKTDLWSRNTSPNTLHAA